MSSLSTKLTTAYLAVTKIFTSNSITQPKDLDGFLSITRKMMADFAHMKSNAKSIFTSNSVCYNDGLIDGKSAINEIDKLYREQTTIITKFISDNDRNKNFLNNYIKYVYAYIHQHYDKEKITTINKHPHLSSPVFSAMFCLPIFIVSDGTISANHFYHTVNPNTNNDVNLFRINITGGKTTTVKNTDIDVDPLLDITCDNIVSIMEQCAIMSAIEKLTKEYGISFQENEGEYVFNYAINVEFTLSLYLPKAYFRLKR